MQGHRGTLGFVYYRKGQHYLILRETEDKIELVEIFHSSMNIETRLIELKDDQIFIYRSHVEARTFFRVMTRKLSETP